MKKNKFFTLEFKIKRAMLIMALFSIYSFSYSNDHILDKIDKNSIWINYSSITDSSRVDSLVNFIIKNKVNIIFLETYNNGLILNDEYMNKNFIKDSLAIGTDSLYNPLQYFLKKSNTSKNLKVYALMDIYKLWTKNYYPEDSTHFYYQCPECLESDINGRSDRLIKLDEIQSLEWEGVFLSPMHPDVNVHIVNKIIYILDNYEFDGILLDQIRYQNYYFGYNSVGMEIFHEEHNIDPQDINRGLISKYYGYNKSEADSIKALWDQYRINSITQLISKVNNIIDTDIYVAVKGSPEDSINRWYQDWDSWLLDDLVDGIIIKNYNLDFKDFNYFNKLISKKYIRSTDYNKIIIGINAIQGHTASYVANKILSLRLQQFSNISLYAYDEYKSLINWYVPIYNTINFNISDE